MTKANSAGHITLERGIVFLRPLVAVRHVIKSSHWRQIPSSCIHRVAQGVGLYGAAEEKASSSKDQCEPVLASDDFSFLLVSNLAG